ncbi:prostasin-like [Brienomyrus brachyistius]|uniref:prostasin-like n=1 Tax=Brienomyrus brachyistius TaxID=42636 RepID=UPI0020B45E22|nr:prostasin-like [Brienomyrus brachyistius]
MLLLLSPFCLLLQELLPPTGASESGILGGETAKPHSRPYMASLQVRGAHTCGGFLIRKDFILTAAHCTKECKEITVVLGGHDISKKEPSQQRITAQKCFRFPGYAHNKYDFDISLIKLMKNATLNEKVKVIELPAKREDVPDGTKCLIPGWGWRVPDALAEKVLREVTLPIQSSKGCKTKWQKYLKPGRMLCTYFDGKNGICQGDSGGPLVCKNKAHGIAAMTAIPCTAPYPDIYMKVSSFITWINQIMNQKYSALQRSPRLFCMPVFTGTYGHKDLNACTLSVCQSVNFKLPELIMLLHLSLFCLLLQELLSLTGASESGILGGETAKPHSRPYMASLQVRGAHTCGGFLIRKDFILTAAHCTKNSKSLTVVLGNNNIKKKKWFRRATIKKVKQCYSHPNNSKNQYDFDIALCKLAKSVTLNKKVNVIELPKQGENVQDQTKCLILGWGKTNPNGAAEDSLREVTVPIQSNGGCKKSWHDHFNDKTMLCTKADSKRGFCQGDSGGPLVCNKKAYGIASFTADPCTAPHPNVYVKISHFIPWINETMKRN